MPSPQGHPGPAPSQSASSPSQGGTLILTSPHHLPSLELHRRGINESSGCPSPVHSFIPEPSHAAPALPPEPPLALPGLLGPEGIGAQTRLVTCCVTQPVVVKPAPEAEAAQPPCRPARCSAGADSCRESGLTGQWDRKSLSGQVTVAAMSQPSNDLREVHRCPRPALPIAPVCHLGQAWPSGESVVPLTPATR